MGPPKRYRYVCLALAALVGAAVAVIPTVASSSTTASIVAVDPYAWQANGVGPAEVAITPGGSVSFGYPAGAGHHYPVLEPGSPAANCTGLPGVFANAGPGWSGSCEFTQAGTYEFWCGVHGALMKAFVYVNPAGTVPVKTAPPPPPPPPPKEPVETTTTSTTTTSPPITTTSTDPAPGGSAGGGSGTLENTPQQKITVAEESSGARLASLSLAKTQRGRAVHGSVQIAASAAGSRLEVDLLAKPAAPAAAAKHPASVRLGRYVKASVKAGKLSFTVALSVRAKGALRRHGHLALSVRLILAPPHGTALVLTRSVTLRR